MAHKIAKTSTGIRKLNTKIYQGELDGKEYFQVRLYSTVVYDEWPDRIRLRHGGWVTPTTASRLRQALMYRGRSEHVDIKNGQMFCNGKPFVNGEFVIPKGD